MRAWALLAIGVVACGGGEEDPPDRPDAQLATDAGAPDGTSFPECTKSCGTRDDCAWDVTPAYGADNWECNGGECDYLGCLSDGECDAAYACRAFDGRFPICVQRCGPTLPCAEENGPDPILDADNYQCVDGACRWLGCLSSDECIERHGAGWECVGQFGVVPGCYRRCAGASECGAEDYYACVDSFCVVSCTSTSCADWTLWGPGVYECR
jgi:hypothetical protein